MADAGWVHHVSPKSEQTCCEDNIWRNLQQRLCWHTDMRCKRKDCQLVSSSRPIRRHSQASQCKSRNSGSLHLEAPTK